MVHRNTPCTECRKHRRKCIRDSLNENCSRCRRLERECVTNDDTEFCLSNSENAKAVIQQIDYLNSIITDLEEQMIRLRDQENTSKDISNNSILVQYQNSPILTNDWTLTIKNGRLHIETNIKSISDLLMHCPPIQYLSPLQNENGLTVQFSPNKNLCLRTLASKILVKCLDSSFNYSNKKPTLSFLSLPTSLLFDARPMIDQLLDIFFQCHSTFHPLIHKPSFMRYYLQLQNPLDSLVCLCICCYVCGAPCNHSLHRFGDLTSAGKYFAGLAKIKLMEQFDIKGKRMENIISINLLVYFLHTLLLNGECKKLLTISYQIVMDLLPSYKEECQKENISIECALYTRNISSLMTYQRSMGMFTDANRSSFYQAACLPWRAMPDESPELIDYIEAHNCLVKLISHSIMSKLKYSTCDVLLGGICTIPFEMILRLDEVINDWWQHLPDRYRICEDWLDLDQCSKSINETTDGVALITFVNFLIYMLGVYSQMLQPKSVLDNTILSIVEKLTLERSLYCCQIVICGFERANHLDMQSSCQYSLAMKRYPFHIVDTLITLSSSSSNQTIRDEAKRMLELCINIIENISYMKLHKIDPSISPLLTKGHTSPKELDDINLSVYFNYPQPWYALIFDMCRYLDSSRTLQNGS